MLFPLFVVSFKLTLGEPLLQRSALEFLASHALLSDDCARWQRVNAHDRKRPHAPRRSSEHVRCYVLHLLRVQSVSSSLSAMTEIDLTLSSLRCPLLWCHSFRALAKEAKRAWIVFWGRDFALLLCASVLYLAGATCASLKGTRGNAEAFACLLRNVAEVGALFVFFERTKLIRPTEPYHKGSLLWQSASGLVPKLRLWRLQVSRAAERLLSSLPNRRSSVSTAETKMTREPSTKRETKVD